MAESQRTVLVLHSLVAQLGLGDIHHFNDEKAQNKYGDTDEEQRRNVAHTGLGRNLTNQYTHEEGSQRTREAVQRTTSLDQLVTLVATTTKQVQHGVNHGIQHTYAETADKCTKQIDDEVPSYHLSVVGKGGCIGTKEAGEVLDEEANGTNSQSYQSGSFITILHNHFTSGNTHEEVCRKVHHITHHASPCVGVTPDVTEGSGHVGYK